MDVRNVYFLGTPGFSGTVGPCRLIDFEPIIARSFVHSFPILSIHTFCLLIGNIW